jgi:large subunit ribosomal protein L16
MSLFNPKFSKFKKYQKGKLTNKVFKNIDLKIRTKTCIKLISLKHGAITSKQFTAIRFLIKKNIKKKGRLNIKIFPQIAITKKPLEIRMGKGKGGFFTWISKVKKGIAIFEIFCKQSLKKKFLKHLKKAQIRLPIKTRLKYE